eukprot:7969227-Alexandrium_andersonii.AAC.1
MSIGSAKHREATKQFSGGRPGSFSMWSLAPTANGRNGVSTQVRGALNTVLARLDCASHECA